MPIPVGTGSSVAPPITPPTQPQVPDTFDAAWTAPDGSVWPLMTPMLGWWTQNAVDGAFGAAPVAITADPYQRGGSIVRHIQPQPRTITWPVRVVGDDHSTWLSRWRSLMLAFSQTRRLGPGTLTITRPDGSRRQISGYYAGGFESQQAQPMSAYLVDTAIVQLYCPDPYWVDPAEITAVRSFSGASAVPFLNPYPTVSSSSSLGDTEILNPGDIEAWPDWVITGPAALIVATNNATGESFTLDPTAMPGGAALTAGQTVTISTDPRTIDGPTVIGPDGVTNWTGALGFPSAVLWPLYPGVNDITLSVTSAGAGTSITMSFHPRYESA